jgi:hypothetical protein
MKVVKNNTTSQIACTVSKIERGSAVLVSSEDHIFTIPVCFLPRLIAPGNTYNITIEETAKAHNRVNTIRDLQKKLMMKKSDVKNMK